MNRVWILEVMWGRLWYATTNCSLSLDEAREELKWHNENTPHKYRIRRYNASIKESK